MLIWNFYTLKCDFEKDEGRINLRQKIFENFQRIFIVAVVIILQLTLDV